MGELGWLFVKGLLLGLSIAAPVGPMAILCIRASLGHGWLAGATSGLGTAVADGTYAAVAAFGVTAVAEVIAGIGPWLALLGGIVLIWLGLRTMRRPPIADAADAPRRGTAASFVTTFLLTLANPPTILFFAAMFAGLGLAGSTAGRMGAAVLVVGVFLGSLGWFMGLSALVRAASGWLTPPVLTWINRGSGLILVAFGVWAVARLWA